MGSPTVRAAMPWYASSVRRNNARSVGDFGLGHTTSPCDVRGTPAFTRRWIASNTKAGIRGSFTRRISDEGGG